MMAAGVTGPAAAMRLAPADQSAAAISLAGLWSYAVEQNYGFVEPLQPGPGNYNTPTVMSNGMIAPLVPFALRGAIWYQGESDAYRARLYRRLLPVLIHDWRRRWGREFSFLFVQIAGYMAHRDEPGDSQWAEVREAQAMALDLPNTGMAVAFDLGDADDLHPKNKQEVGRRLALNALALTYGLKDVVYSGPIFEEAIQEGPRWRIRFRHAESGLTTQDGGPVKGFAMAGEDRRFHWAEAVIAPSTSSGQAADVVVTCAVVAQPVAVRYGWANNPDCNLLNVAGLPAAPFRIDDWCSKEPIV